MGTWKGESVVRFGGVLLVFEVAALVGESDEVGEDHAAVTDMEDRLGWAGLDVLLAVVVETSLDGTLYVVERQHRLHVLWQLRHLLPLYLVVEPPQRHSFLPQDWDCDFNTATTTTEQTLRWMNEWCDSLPLFLANANGRLLLPCLPFACVTRPK